MKNDEVKANDIFLKEYVKNLSDNELSFLDSRLHTKAGGDLSEVSEYIAHDKQLDPVFAAAKSYQDWFDLIDILEAKLDAEIKLRDSQVEKLDL